MTDTPKNCMNIGCNRPVQTPEPGAVSLILMHDLCVECSPTIGALTDRLDAGEHSKAHNHYFKDVTHLEYVDVYRILKLFSVTDPCMQHLVKKALCAGNRGHKNRRRDLEDIRDSAERALEMLDEDEDTPEGIADRG